MAKHAKIFFWLWAIALQIGLFFLVHNDPFFGDAISSTAQAVNYIYNQNLATVFYPPEIDPGHPTLYTWLMAACFKVFSKTLLVAHAFSCFWALVFLYSFMLAAKHWASAKSAYLGGFFVTIFATYLAQSAMMLNTLAVMSFFLLAVNAIKKNKPAFTALFATAMCLTHLQGAFLLLSLAVFQLYLNRHNGLLAFIKQYWLVYSIPFAAFVGWLKLHYTFRGWYFVSPNYTDANELNDVLIYIKALLTIAWRLIDFGMLVPYIIVAWSWLKLKASRPFITEWLMLLLPTALGMAIFLNNTIGHRYFLAFNMLALNLVAMVIMEHITHKKIVVAAVLLSLVVGNFMYYPGKNLGDGTLAYRGIFNVMQQIKSEFNFNQPAYSHAPIANPTQLTHLSSIGFEVARINDTPLDSLPIIIQSNVNAEFSVNTQLYLREKWHGKTYQHGYVYANVFLNPRYYNKPPNWELKALSNAEKFMLKLKKMAGK